MLRKPGASTHINKENDNFPRLWLKGELLRYTKSFKFLVITFVPKLTYQKHILDIVKRAKKRLNLLKALQGQIFEKQIWEDF